jgi:two-component system chemotaxis response regulator CheB
LACATAKQHFTRPAVDPLFMSAAQAYGSRVLGLLLSGGGADGVLGLIQINARGGLTLVQRPDEARQPSMPATALREDDVDGALTVSQLIHVVPALAQGERVKTNGQASP